MFSGDAIAMVTPTVNTGLMQTFLDGLSGHPRGEHAILVLAPRQESGAYLAIQRKSAFENLWQWTVEPGPVQPRGDLLGNHSPLFFIT